MTHRKLMLALGLVFSLGAAAAAPPAAPGADVGPPPVTALSMMASSLLCADLDRSIAFYTNGLGMTVRGRIENPSGTEVPLMFPGGGAYIILFKAKAAGAAASHGASRLILAVPDVKVLEAKLVAAGYHLSAPIAEQPKYHVAVGQLEDPDGNHLELVQRTP
jgi:catechol 2,3-dioxygenase-like lactoylglutathione lyase family enzyme